VTRIVDELMEARVSQETEDYRHFDPKQLRQTSGAGSSGRSSTPFQEAIVFVVGGGNYIEYQNLVDYTKVCIAPQYKVFNTTVCHVVNTGSCLITKVKQHQMRSVIGWVNAVKSWFNLPFTKTHCVVYIRKELMPESIGVAVLDLL
jgi:hypothetical protein